MPVLDLSTLPFDAPECPARPTWNATPEQLKAKKYDEEDIQCMVEYRSKFTSQWDRGVRAWNLLAEPVNDPDVSNVLFPFARMLCTSALTAMSKGRPGFGMRPGGPSDFAKVDMLWKPAIDSVMDDSDYEAHNEYFLTDYEVMGTGVMEVFSQTPIRTERRYKADDANNNPVYEDILKPDYTRPKLGIRYRSPYECGISPFGRTPQDAPSCYFEESMSWQEYIQNYARVIVDGKNKYMNTKCVFPGKIVTTDGQGQLQFRESSEKGVIIVCYQNKIKDVYRLYANGVLILDVPLKKIKGSKIGGINCIGETTLCFGANWHQYDSNRRTHAHYGMGDPHLIRGLDIIYQAFSNLTVDNWVSANTNILSFKGMDGVGPGIDELTMKSVMSGYALKNRGEVISTPAGQVNLAHYDWYRQFLEEMGIWLSRNNFKKLSDQKAMTAYELFQKVEADNEGFEHRLKKLEIMFRKMGRLTLAGVMSDLTVEDYEDLSETELGEIIQGIDEGKLSPDDYDLSSKLIDKSPPRRKMRYKIRTKGRVYAEKPNKTGKFDRKSLQEQARYRDQWDGYVPARGEYIWSQEYIERGGVPDVYVEGRRMLGDSQNVKMAKIKMIAEYARARIAEGNQFPEMATDFDMKKLDRELVKAVDIPQDDVMKKDDAIAKKIEEADGILDVLQKTLRPLPDSPSPDVLQGSDAPPPSAAPAASFSPAQTPDLERFTPFGGSGGRSPSPVGGAGIGPQ